MKSIAIIPARYASTRFPGKPLVELAGKSMIQRVVEQVRKASSISAIIVATDDERIAAHVKGFGGEVMMTSPNHPSGTDRCAEVLEKCGLNPDIVINVQGDEPFIRPEQIERLVTSFASPAVQIATLIKSISEKEELFDPNVVKAVRGTEGHALYFSRHPIPYIRGKAQEEWLQQHTFYRHLGVYGYRAAVLPELTKLEPSLLEKAESLEQLRWLENGYHIATVETDFRSLAIDTPEDVIAVEKFLAQQPEYR